MVDFTGENDAFLDLSTEEVGGKKQEPLKPGEYLARIEKAEVKNIKNGKAIKLSWKVIESDQAGKYAGDFILFQHSNPDAQRIGRERLKGICVAAGKNPVLSGVKDFIGMKAIIGTRIEENDGKQYAHVTYYEPAPADVQNEVL